MKVILIYCSMQGFLCVFCFGHAILNWVFKTYLVYKLLWSPVENIVTTKLFLKFWLFNIADLVKI